LLDYAFPSLNYAFSSVPPFSLLGSRIRRR
jgi:hypothetical protein